MRGHVIVDIALTIYRQPSFHPSKLVPCPVEQHSEIVGCNFQNLRDFFAIQSINTPSSYSCSRLGALFFCCRLELVGFLPEVENGVEGFFTRKKRGLKIPPKPFIFQMERETGFEPSTLSLEG